MMEALDLNSDYQDLAVPMSEKGHHSKTTREERLAANLRANLRRRKQAARKSKSSAAKSGSANNLNPDKPSP